MSRKARVDRSPEEKWQIVQEGLKSGNVAKTRKNPGQSPDFPILQPSYCLRSHGRQLLGARSPRFARAAGAARDEAPIGAARNSGNGTTPPLAFPQQVPENLEAQPSYRREPDPARKKLGNEVTVPGFQVTVPGFPLWRQPG